MAGSKKWFKYTTDTGNTFGVNLDESNVESINGAENDLTGADNVVFSLPPNVAPRKIRYRSADAKVSRLIVALTPAIYSDIIAGTNAQSISINSDGATYVLGLIEGVGERLRRPVPFDTGIDDGDAS